MFVRDSCKTANMMVHKEWKVKKFSRGTNY